MEANEIVDEYFCATFKRSSALIEQHRPFFEGLIDIEEVVVLGHSLSTVDALYVAAMTAQPAVAAALWRVARSRAHEWPERRGRLVAMGLQQACAAPVIWDDL